MPYVSFTGVQFTEEALVFISHSEKLGVKMKTLLILAVFFTPFCNGYFLASEDKLKLDSNQLDLDREGSGNFYTTPYQRVF